MTDEIADESFMLFNTSQRRQRRNAFCHIFECLEDDERIAFFQEQSISPMAIADLTGDENGQVDFCFAMDSSTTISTPETCSPSNDQQNIPKCPADSTKEKDRLSGLVSEEESSVSLSMDTARPSCLVGLNLTSLDSSSSSPSGTDSSMSFQTPSSFSSSSSNTTSTSSSVVDEDNLQSCSTENTNSDTPGFTTSPSSSMCYSNSSFSRVRRNALHDLFETLTQDDIQKLKTLYKTTLYSLTPFSESAQSPIRGLHECKA